MRTILLYFVLLFPLYLIGQTYTPTVVEGRKWTFSYHTTGPSNFYHYLKCDTILDNHIYHVIWHYNSNTDPYSATIGGYVREDTTAQQIYYKRNATTPEKLIIDYTLQVSDTITYLDNLFTVYSTGITFIEGQNRKTVQLLAGGAVGMTYYEGLGVHRSGVLPNIPRLFNSIVDLNINCQTPVNVIQIEDKEAVLTLSPNPCYASLQLNLDTQELPFIAAIYNASGMLVQRKIIEQNSLDVHTLPSGMYVLKIEGKKPTIFTKY